MTLSAHARGQTETVIGRAAELYGPRVESLFGASLFTAALNGRTAIWPGDPDLPVTSTFIGDFGRGLADLGQLSGVTGSVFHIQVPPVTTGRQLIEAIGRAAGTSPKVGRLTPGRVRLLKAIAPIAREGAELLYHFNQPFLIDDSRIRELTGRAATGWEDGIGQTLDWYRADPERSRYRLLPGHAR
jgi:nucleoside-diphosphate-sugar epimerase